MSPRPFRLLVPLLVLVLWPCGVLHAGDRKIDPDGSRAAAMAEVARSPSGRLAPPSGAQAPPDVIGPGKVLTVGNLHMKVTNWGHLGNLFPDFSSDPAGRWPATFGAEYLSSIRLAVGAVNPVALDPHQIRLVSEGFEWRPPTLDPVDSIYEAHEGVASGVRFVNDDGDHDPITGEPRVDEEFLDGHDNDNDGRVDEDYAAIGQQMFSLLMRDDTPEAIKAGVEEPHVPIGLECHQTAWAYSVSGFEDFDVVDYTITNVSGHTLDSLTIGWLVDMDCGASAQDDLDLPGFPSGEFTLALPTDDARRQWPHSPTLDGDVSPDSALCSRLAIRINGFATSDDDADNGRTPGIPAFLLVDHTIDPVGLRAPQRVGFRAFRSARVGVPYGAGGIPTDDSTRFAFMTGSDHVDPVTGFIDQAPGTVAGDYVQWCSVGPFRLVPSGASVHATIAFAVQYGTHATALGYGADYQAYRSGSMSGKALTDKYWVLLNAFRTQVAFEGRYETNGDYPGPNFHGRETIVRPKPEEGLFAAADCHDLTPRYVTYPQTDWFDFDCNYCTGVWDYPGQVGLLHHTWVTPPPTLTAVESEGPSALRVASPVPNPARGGTRIRFELPEAAPVRLEVFDLSGRLVRQLAGGNLEAGRHSLWWDGRDLQGGRVPSGLYLFRVTAGGRSLRGKVVLAR